MCDFINLRQMCARKIIKTMGLDYNIDDVGSIQVERGEWLVEFPEDDETIMLIGFNDSVTPAYAADVAMRFYAGLLFTAFDVAVLGNRWNQDSTATGAAVEAPNNLK